MTCWFHLRSRYNPYFWTVTTVLITRDSWIQFSNTRHCFNLLTSVIIKSFSILPFGQPSKRNAAAYRYIENWSFVSSEDEQWSSCLDFEAAYRLIHWSGEERTSAVIGRHRVDGSEVPMECQHARGRVQWPRLGCAVARPRHDQVASYVHLLLPHDYSSHHDKSVSLSTVILRQKTINQILANGNDGQVA